MGRMEDGFVDLTVTSPPYDDISEKLSIVNGEIVKSYETKSILRDYKGYSWDIQAMAKELFRVTKDGGVVVWVMNDPMVDGSESLASCYTRIIFQEVGWSTHDTMIYEKHNFNNPSNNRYHQMFEYMFVFSKGNPKIFNPIKDKPNKYAGQTAWGKNTSRQKDGSLKEKDKKVYSDFGMRGNIWRYTVGTSSNDDEIAFEHPAIFPSLLAKEMILSWSNPEDVVYDCFAGSGTTLKMALQTNRKWIGSEISSEYCELIKRRLATARRLF